MCRSLIKNLMIREYKNKPVKDNVLFFWVYELRQPIYEADTTKNGRYVSISFPVEEEYKEDLIYYLYNLETKEFESGSGDLVYVGAEHIYLDRQSFKRNHPNYEKYLIKLENEFSLK